MELDAQTLMYMPCAMLVINRDLTPLACSRKGFSVLGVRAGRVHSETDLLALGEVLRREEGLVPMLRDAMARLHRPGGDVQFRWMRGARVYEVAVGALQRGEDRRFVVLFQDVTQQIQFEETRETARRFLEDILNNVHLGVIVLNREMRITNMNRAQEGFLHRLGVWLSWVEAIGMPVSELVPQDEATLWAAITETVLIKGEAYEVPRQRYETQEGDLVLSVAVTPLKDRDGQVIGAIQVSEDVTERVRLEAELRQAEIVAERLEAVKETAIAVNHEVNNPLTTILGAAQLMLMSGESMSEKTRERLMTIEHEVKRIARVTQRLKDLDEVKTDDYIADGPKMLNLGLDEG